MTLFTLLIALIAVYYVAHGRRLLSLERFSEPAFFVNATYLLNFPGRALALFFFGDALESAPALVWDIETCNTVLAYSTACIVLFNFSYEYFLGRRLAGSGISGAELPQMQAIRAPALVYFAALAAIYLYFVLTSRTSINFVHDIAESDIPQIVHLLEFALDACIAGSLIMFLRTRRWVFLASLALFYGAYLYYSFLLTAKYALIGYLVVLLLVASRCRFAVRPWHLAVVVLLAIPYFIGSYSVRDHDLAVISPEQSLAQRLSLVSELFEDTGPGEALTRIFLVKVTDRFVYLEAFMVYLQALDQNVALDLYDKWGSLPTYKMAIPSVFGIDKSTVQNIHVWFANKYWYGLPSDYYAVIVPFGRITESFMMLGWAGVVLFPFYAFLFSWLYRKFFCSSDPLLVIYYLAVFYHYILVDDNLLFNVATVAYGTVFFFASKRALELLAKRAPVAPRGLRA